MMLQIGQRDSVRLTIEEWREKDGERRAWSERSSSAGSPIVHRLFALTPGREYELLQNGVVDHVLKADDKGEMDFETNGEYVTAKQFEIRVLQRSR
jgi:hypothetical protein